MTPQEKELLLKDLCGRLPYGVKVYNTSFAEPQIHTLFGRVSDDEFLMLETYKSVGGEDYRRVTDDVHYTGYLESIKPYLRPMSSMTDEEREEWADLFNLELDKLNEIDDENKAEELAPYYFGKSHQVSIDWLNKKGFDYRGLIPMGLALEAPEGMYK